MIPLIHFICLGVVMNQSYTNDVATGKKIGKWMDIGGNISLNNEDCYNVSLKLLAASHQESSIPKRQKRPIKIHRGTVDELYGVDRGFKIHSGKRHSLAVGRVGLQTVGNDAL
jgi:hypothetical protein